MRGDLFDPMLPMPSVMLVCHGEESSFMDVWLTSGNKGNKSRGIASCGPDGFMQSPVFSSVIN